MTALPYKVNLLIRKRSDLADYLESLGANLHLCNLSNSKSYENIVKNSDIAFHLAAENTTETKNRTKTIRNTYGITKSFIDFEIKLKSIFLLLEFLTLNP